MSKASSDLSMTMIYIFMGLMVVTGSINTIANKMQNELQGLKLDYKHVWFITFCMFLGETTCLIWYGLHLYRESKKTPMLEDSSQSGKDDEIKDKKPEASIWLLAIPALCDFFGSTIMTFGLTMMAGSVYQMFRGSLILFTAIFSVIFLKNKLYRHNYFALIVVILGLSLVGMATMIWPAPTPEGCSESAGASNSIGGIVLVIVAQLFSASQFIIEEKIMKSYSCHPLKAVGVEGAWGTLMYLVILVIFQFIKCTPPPSKEEPNLSTFICTYNDKGEWLLEDTLFAFRQIGDNGLLMFFVILYIFSIALFNYVGISVTKYASSPARAVVDTVRTVVVWIFFLMPFINKCYRETFNFLQLIGFVLLVLGTVIYNEVVAIPFFGMDKYLKCNLKQNEEEEKLNTIDEALVTDKVNKMNY